MKITLDKDILTVAALTVAALLALVFITPNPVRASIVGSTPIGTATTSAAFSVTTSARVLATTTSTVAPSYTRIYATICNPNTNPVALNLDGDKAASGPLGNVTAYIAAAAGYQACYEITDRNQYSGSVTASSTNQTATAITVKDYVQ